MHQRIPRVPLFFTILGCLPFIAQFFLFALQLTDADFVLRLAEFNYYSMHAILIFGFIILVFLTGIDWGLAVNHHEGDANIVYFWSIGVLLCTFAVMALSFYRIYVFSILAALFGITWFGDYMLHRRKYCPEWYLRLRCIITPVVLMSLLGIQVVVYFVKI